MTGVRALMTPEMRGTQDSVDQVFGMVESWFAETMGQPPLPEPGSALSGDDRRLGNLQLSHVAWAAHVSAVEHLNAVRVLVAGARHLDPPLFTLLRSALENAATVVWLLAPASRPLRLTLALRVAWTDVQESATVQRTGEGPAAPGREPDVRLAEIRSAAAALGLPAEKVCKMVGYRQLVVDAATAAGYDAAYTEVLWRLCSGFAHARRWAQLGYLDRSPTGLPPVDGVHTIQLTTSLASVWPPLMVAAFMVERGRELFETRRLSVLG